MQRATGLVPHDGTSDIDLGDFTPLSTQAPGANGLTRNESRSTPIYESGQRRNASASYPVYKSGIPRNESTATPMYQAGLNRNGSTSVPVHNLTMIRNESTAMPAYQPSLHQRNDLKPMPVYVADFMERNESTSTPAHHATWYRNESMPFPVYNTGNFADVPIPSHNPTNDLSIMTWDNASFSDLDTTSPDGTASSAPAIKPLGLPDTGVGTELTLVDSRGLTHEYGLKLPDPDTMHAEHRISPRLLNLGIEWFFIERIRTEFKHWTHEAWHDFLVFPVNRIMNELIDLRPGEQAPDQCTPSALAAHLQDLLGRRPDYAVALANEGRIIEYCANKALSDAPEAEDENGTLCKHISSFHALSRLLGHVRSIQEELQKISLAA